MVAVVTAVQQPLKHPDGKSALLVNRWSSSAFSLSSRWLCRKLKLKSRSALLKLPRRLPRKKRPQWQHLQPSCLHLLPLQLALQWQFRCAVALAVAVFALILPVAWVA